MKEIRELNTFFQLINTSDLDKKLEMEQFPFSRFLFWDVPTENIDKAIHRKFIIERVLTRGKLEDFYMLTKLYSIEEIQQAVLQSRELDAKTANFCSSYFGLPIKEIHVSSYYS